MKNDILTNDSKQYLSWIRNRLKFKYHEDDNNITQLMDIIKNKKIISGDISNDIVEKICCKLWPNFDGNNSGDIVGISEYDSRQQDEIRSLVRNILTEARKLGS